MAKKAKRTQAKPAEQPPEDQSTINNQQSSIQSPHPAFKLRHTLRGHTNSVFRMALSPDGQFLASPSVDNTVRLWDVASGKLLRMLEHGNFVICVAWSPDGQMLAVGSGDNGYLWNAATGQQFQVLQAHTDMIHSVAWSPDGQTLASCSNDRTIRLWDVATGRTQHELKGHTEKVYGIAWSPDGQRICSGSWDDTVRLWDVATGEELQILKGNQRMLLCVAWSPDGQYIASGSYDRAIRIWNAETGQQTYVLEGHTSYVISISFLDEGRLLASLAHNGMVVFWQTDIWEEVVRFRLIDRNDLNISNLAFHSSLPVMAAVGENNQQEINIWELDFALLHGAEVAPTIHYVNAKAVLLGESGVGKSGLGIRIAEGKYRPTEGSTHGAQFWHLPVQDVPGLPENLQAELTLWDLARAVQFSKPSSG